MGTGKKKIEIKKIEDEQRRMVTFSKRRKGLFKKVKELRELSGAKIAVIAFSPAGNPYTSGDVSLFDAALGKILNDGLTSGGDCDIPAASGLEPEKGADTFAASTSYQNKEMIKSIPLI